ncbi:MAG: hypothetical protein IIA27_15660, partial [Gemmatimonadetes bacterium]|nr:hypothetical protein [Gemmatimonadota bacterium]
EDLTARGRDTIDPGHPLLVCVRVKKPQDWNATRPVYDESIYVPVTVPAVLSDSTGHYGDAYL